jgi:hypothetical protein
MDKIDFHKDERNLIIYNNNQDISYLNTDKYKYCLLSDMPIYKIYYGEIYNPPFFNNIISIKNNSFEEVKQIWNMTLINGLFLIDDKYQNLFTNSIYHKDLNNKKIIVKKNYGLCYQFPQYRIIDFIIAGTMKGGTTAAITNLSKHPDISMVKEEIHYFDDKLNYQKGIEWYKKHFDYSKKMVGDKNHDVMYEYNCHELLQMINPHVKIILFLRNPIDRAYSHWKMTRDLFKNKKSFEYCIYDEIKNRWNENRTNKISFWYHFVQRGLYYDQIKNLLKYFPIDNIYIAISENIITDMNGGYNKICKFLNIPEFINKQDFVKDFVSDKLDNISKSDKIYEILYKIYKKDVKKLEKLIGYKTNWFNE